MASRNKTRINEAKKLAKEARFVFGHAETRTERLLGEIRSYLEDIREDDHHMTAIAKHHVRRYFKEGEGAGVELTEDMSYADLFEHWQQALQPIYTWYLDASSWPCNARYPATDYIPSAEELDTHVPQHSQFNPDGTRKTYAQLEMEGLIADAPTLRELMPDIPLSWEQTMLDRRRRFPEQYARKEERRDDD